MTTTVPRCAINDVSDREGVRHYLDFRRRLYAGDPGYSSTLGTTRFYAPTRPGHFTELLNDLKPFLRPENLLFATIDGREVGFCFWHPDYNEILPTGRRVSRPGIAWRFALRRSGIRTVILNALGVLPEYRGVATAALLGRMTREIEGRFARYETSFVWDGNYASIGVGHYLESQELRQYAVWVEDLQPRSTQGAPF